jgi:hypothetical protein
MNKPRPHPAERLLEQARSAAPVAGVRARVLAGLEQRIAGDAGIDPAPASLLAPPFARVPLAGSARVASTSASALAALRWASFGVAMGALGYWWGRHEGEEMSRAAPVVVAAPSVAPVASVAAVPAPEAAPVEVVAAAAAAPEPVVAAAPRAARRATKPRAPSHDELLTLAQALELVRRAEAELRAGDASGARVLLGELDRGAPARMLREERLAARALAACLDGDASGAERYELELAAENPSSMYRGRIESSCAGLGR